MVRFYLLFLVCLPSLGEGVSKAASSESDGGVEESEYEFRPEAVDHVIEHVVLQEKLELKVLEQRYCLGIRCIQKSPTQATSCRALVLLDTVSKLCDLPWEVFYDTLET